MVIKTSLTRQCRTLFNPSTSASDFLTIADLATQCACLKVFPWKLSHVPVLFVDVNRWFGQISGRVRCIL